MKRIKKAPLLLSLLLMLSLIASPNISQVFADNNGSGENEVITEETKTNKVENEIEELTQGSINGLLWFDKNENGIKEANESIISGVTLYLYSTDDKSNAITQTASDTNGNYVFDNLNEGSYYVAIRAQVINGTNYLIPIASIQTGTDNKFDVDYSIELIASYSNSISINENDVININAGMRKQQTIVPLSGSYIVTNDTTSATSNHTSLKEAVETCTNSSYKYTITVNASDTSIGDAITIEANQDITIVSAGLSTFTLNQDKDGDRHFNVNGSLTLDNVILQGNGNSADGNENGGVKVNSGGSLTVESDAAIQSCNWDKGGAINSDNGTIIIKGFIINNNAKSDGGGIYLTGSGGKPSHLTITDDAVISNNKAQNGAGIYSNWQATIDIKGGSITSNTASNEGGGAKIDRSTVKMSAGKVDANTANSSGGGFYLTGGSGNPPRFELINGAVSNNKAHDGAGIYSNWQAIIDIQGGSITTNTASNDGAGIHFNSGTLTMSGGSIDNNTSTHAAGGIKVTDGATVNISGGVIDTNTSGTNGDGIYIEDSTLNLTNGKITGNNTTGEGGGVRANRSTIKINNGDIEYNTAANGAGIYINGESYKPSSIALTGGSINNNTASGDGGGIRVTTGTSLTITDSKLEDNTAAHGAGFSANNNSNAIIDSSSFNDNIATQRGGGINIDNSTTMKITDSTITGNKANTGGGIIASLNSTIDMDECTITGNSVTGDGGAVKLENSSLAISTANINGNTANNHGGGVYLTWDGSLIMNAGSIKANIAGNDGGGIYTEDLSYKSNADPLKYSNIVINKNNVDVSGNTAIIQNPNPTNANVFTNFDGALLDNYEINYYPEKYNVIYNANGGNSNNIEETYNIYDPVNVKTQSELGFAAPGSNRTM